MENFEEFLLMMMKSRKLVHEIYPDIFTNCKLNLNFAMCIIIINRTDGGMSASGICDRCGFDKAQVSRILREMTDEGYIVRNPDDDELKRGYRYLLTDKGKQLIMEMEHDMDCITEYFIGDIPKENIDIFFSVLVQIHERISSFAESGHNTVMNELNICKKDRDLNNRRNEEENA